jgi:release factor glutamine methyltransferase
LSTIRELYVRGRSLLKRFPDSASESKVLLLKSLTVSEEFFHAHPDQVVPGSKERLFLNLVSDRIKGVPLAYLTGEKEFWSLPFQVSPDVLIPRPETELLVEKVIQFSSKKAELIVDIGTGAGNIAIALAGELPQARILATDISPAALETAQINASRHRVHNVTFLKGSLFAPLKNLRLEGKCDFIVSNPPYVSQSQWETLPEDIRLYEPKIALVPGTTGLEILQKIIDSAPRFLKPYGRLCLEIGFGLKDKVLDLFGKAWAGVDCFEDLGGVPRVVVGTAN